jgi:hypothetical protein
VSSAARWDAGAAEGELYAAHRRLVRLSVLLVRDLQTAEEVALLRRHARMVAGSP